MEGTSRKCLFVIVILVESMIGFKNEEPFCDLQCRVCGGWTMQSCLFSESLPMRTLAARCLGKGELLLFNESQIIGLWKKSLVLDCKVLDVTPPTYKNETMH